MKKLLLSATALLVVSALYACQSAPAVNTMDEPPEAQKRSSERSFHGKVLHDDYFWLKDQSYPEVDDKDILEYLRSENSWYEQKMASRQDLIDTLFEEMKARIEEDQSAVPWQEGGYEYRWRYVPGSQYRLWERRPAAGGEYVTILDEAAEAEGIEYFSRGNFSISPNGRMLAWSADVDGSEHQHLFVDDLVSGTRYDDGLHRVSAGNLAWGADSKTLIYAPLEDDGWYIQRVKSHRIGTSVTQDIELFYNPDRSLFMRLSESQSREYVLISLDDRSKSEVRYLRTDSPLEEPSIVSPMRDGHRYKVDHGHGRFYILSNDKHINFRIVTAPETQPSENSWAQLIAPSDTAYLRELVILNGFIAVQEVSKGLRRIRTRTLNGKEEHIEFPESVYAAYLGNNPSLDADFLRLTYESMITPESVYDYQPDSRELELRQQQQIPSGYDMNNYRTTRVWAEARDGVKVPISIVYQKDVAIDGTAPLLMYGYGAYSYGTDPGFSSARLSLLDRGVVYAIAHVRGGDEMGYQWYLDGKLEKRTNTFNDFVDSAKHLVSSGYARGGNIAIVGGSAGGELVGAVVIQAPELWSAAILQVPFVDVLNTMLDESLPLTPVEWLEWGNPIDSESAFELIQSYSPYDNIESRDYPAMMVTGGLNDPRVTYWEPAKWTARMRALKTDDNELIMKINMGAGHHGKTGRYADLYEKAEYYAFALSHLHPAASEIPLE